MAKLLLFNVILVSVFSSILLAKDYKCIKKCKDELVVCYSSETSISECTEIYTACSERCGGGE